LRLAALFSGGKDSTYAIYLAEKMNYLVDMLISIQPTSSESLYFHYPNVELTRLQAKAMKKKHIYREAEDELQVLREVLEEVSDKIDGIVSGVISSKFQKNTLEKICREFGLIHIAPLWNREPLQLVREIIESGFEIMITGVAAMGMSKEWLGKILQPSDLDLLKELNKKFGINPCGEGGEIETLVLDAPIFYEKLEVEEYEIKWFGDYGYLLVSKAKLRGKP